ncbi:hypothetical protein EXIGLDRAFT_30250 [Exidia glandulosa HHB12029]|uniref:Uncharacterized protein n=1 Tax=Exidia glandulosa HHB12029 TaxID=1314781 RepID=A0A165PB58_EXIGL|nr:hypothetical protein EXIGLDRAFT_30250 [Exidia glandulosa HHB12029]
MRDEVHEVPERSNDVDGVRVARSFSSRARARTPSWVITHSATTEQFDRRAKTSFDTLVGQLTGTVYTRSSRARFHSTSAPLASVGLDMLPERCQHRSPGRRSPEPRRGRRFADLAVGSSLTLARTRRSASTGGNEGGNAEPGWMCTYIWRHSVERKIQDALPKSRADG